MKQLKKAERKQVARRAADNRKSNALYIKHATAALDAHDTMQQDRENE